MFWAGFDLSFAVAGGAALAALLLGATVLAARLLVYRNTGEVEDHGSAGFTRSRYEPMSRLLSEEDFEFLSSQPGYRPEIGERFRKDRRRIFRMYLRELAADFHQLHASARQMAANSPEANAGLVGVLLRQQFTFWRAMAGIEIRLLVPGVKLDVRGLVEALDAMRADLNRLTAAA